MKKKQLICVLSIGLSVILTGCSKDSLTSDSPQPGAESTKPGVEEFVPSTLNDSLALVSLYKALDGENWEYSNWTKTPIRYWDGVQVSIVNGQQRVTSVELYGSSLKGELPTQIKMLTELKRLIIAESRNLKGSIIDEVYDLKKLRVLDFRFTELSGELSPRIGQLTELDTLVLWKSQFAAGTLCEDDKSGQTIDVSWEPNTVLFSGSIPQEIGMLTNLKELNFARTGFTGELPASLGDLAAITRMDLSQCRFTGNIPASLGQLNNLEWLALCKNELSGQIPTEICDAKNLETLIVSDNKLTGGIPSNIGSMSKLNYFDIANNQISGTIPVSMEDNSRLGIFYANDNLLTGTIPAELGRKHPFLVVVNLVNNQLTGSLPDIVGNETTAGIWTCIFYAANNRLNGTVPALWMRFPNDARKYFLPQQSGYGFDNLQ